MTEKQLKLLDLNSQAADHFDRLINTIYDLEKESGENLAGLLDALGQFASGMTRFTALMQEKFPDPKDAVEDLFKDLKEPGTDAPPQA